MPVVNWIPTGAKNVNTGQYFDGQNWGATPVAPSSAMPPGYGSGTQQPQPQQPQPPTGYGVGNSTSPIPGNGQQPTGGWPYAGGPGNPAGLYHPTNNPGGIPNPMTGGPGGYGQQPPGGWPGRGATQRPFSLDRNYGQQRSGGWGSGQSSVVSGGWRPQNTLKPWW